MLKKCQYCGKDFEAKSQRAKFCSTNCRCSFRYHKENKNARFFNKNKTPEEKRLERNEYARKYYREHIDKVMSEEAKEKRRIVARRYYKNHRAKILEKDKIRYLKKKNG